MSAGKTRRKIWGSAFAISCVALTIAQAGNRSPAGIWKTIDDKTGHAKSILEIREQNGELTAKVLQVLESPYGPHPVCKLCSGERKDKPVEGMTVMWGVRKEGAGWGGGYILDPQNGRTYRVKLTLAANGQKLDVHGYYGIAFIGRSQLWEREK